MTIRSWVAIWMLLALCTVVSAFAQRATLIGTPPNVNSCAYERIVTSGLDLTVYCKTAPVPTIPPIVGCSTTAIPMDLGDAGGGRTFDLEAGKVYAFELPVNKRPIGTISSTGKPGTPQEMSLTWAISRCQGDFVWAGTGEASSKTSRGNTVYQCQRLNGGVESTGLRWGGPDGCPVKTGERWYANVKITGGCSGVCPVVVSWY